MIKSGNPHRRGLPDFILTIYEKESRIHLGGFHPVDPDSLRSLLKR